MPKHALLYYIAETYPILHGWETLLGPGHESAAIAYLNTWRVSHTPSDQLRHILLRGQWRTSPIQYFAHGSHHYSYQQSMSYPPLIRSTQQSSLEVQRSKGQNSWVQTSRTQSFATKPEPKNWGAQLPLFLELFAWWNHRFSANAAYHLRKKCERCTDKIPHRKNQKLLWGYLQFLVESASLQLLEKKSPDLSKTLKRLLHRRSKIEPPSSWKRSFPGHF